MAFELPTDPTIAVSHAARTCQLTLRLHHLGHPNNMLNLL